MLDLCLGMHNREKNQDSDLNIKRTYHMASSVIGISLISRYYHANNVRKAVLLSAFYSWQGWADKICPS